MALAHLSPSQKEPEREKEEESEDESEVLEESPCGRWHKRKEQVVECVFFFFLLLIY